MRDSKLSRAKTSINNNTELLLTEIVVNVHTTRYVVLPIHLLSGTVCFHWQVTNNILGCRHTQLDAFRMPSRTPANCNANTRSLTHRMAAL